jgi:hypothetical protein
MTSQSAPRQMVSSGSMRLGPGGFRIVQRSVSAWATLFREAIADANTSPNSP